ncbi:HTH-type transcriptional activator RhaR [Paenibacillus auburnensis]|uniref:HTH-type transcriptional activator RhaR n=1 Tax=Paenibacillus auburnensis TaxID=2905649 RepID=A0ABN8G042_9BACL|nr:helix-turn-helix domain-containing protein [Paenibacillus auburnensis]CAH1195651.1 HTH-type transcriptional activator RhaR [Paenibacillus auburnensis]
MDSNLEKNLKLCDLVAGTFDLHVFYIDPAGKIIYESPNNQLLNPLYENQKQSLFTRLNFYASKPYDFPLIQKSAFSEKFILISVFNNQAFEGTVLIGPTVAYSLSSDRVNGIIHDSLGFFFRDKVIQYYNSIPVVPHERLIQLSSLVFHLFNQVYIAPETVWERNGKLAEPYEKMEKSDLIVSQNLQANTYHERLFEKKMLEIIKEGRVEELTQLPTLKEEEVASVLSKTSYFRSNKNHIITLITLVSRAAIDGGLHEEVAFSLHDRFIQQLEEANTLEGIRELAKEVLYTYAEKVQQVKNERYSKTVTTCKDYIYKHIYENISHDDIARKVDLSPKYLSSLFKKEVGITVSEYIQNTKINEAKKLLSLSKTPISEICTLLNFNDQSYFTKVFKKVSGVTPMYYRERHHLLDRK